MNEKQFLMTAFSSLLLFSLLVGVQFIRLAEANFLPAQKPQPVFTILSDGSVDSLAAPIQRNGEVYTLTDDIIGYAIAIERDNVVLDGGGYTLQGNGNSTGVFIRNQNGITVRNMEIRDHFFGIRLLTDYYIEEITGNHVVSGNNIANNTYGIYISYSSDNVLRNNHMKNNKHSLYVTYSPLGQNIASFVHDIDPSNTINGKSVYYWVNQQGKTIPSAAGYVMLVSCTNIQVQNLELTGNGQGVLLVSTTFSTITSNNITNDSGYGIYLYKSSNNCITENIIANKDDNGIYLYQSSNNVFSENTITANNQDGIHLLDCSHNSMTGNTIRLNNGGIYVHSGGANNSIGGNTITENIEYGVSLDWANNNNLVSENFIAENGLGIYIRESSHNWITGNTIKDNNGWAIRLEGGQRDNVIYHNYFIDNNVEVGFQVSIPGLWQPGVWEPGNPNVWDDGERGNYWSDYLTRYTNATEIGGSGIGDTPFYINPNNIDHYPVMKTNIIPEFPSCIILPLLIVATLVVTIVRNKLIRKG